MTVEEEYRKHAAGCRFLAECSPKMADRAFWLLLAQNWQLLAQDSEAARTMNSKVPRSNAASSTLGQEPLCFEIRHCFLACRAIAASVNRSRIVACSD